MLAAMLPSHASCGKVAQPPRSEIEVLPHREEVGYSCWLVAECSREFS
jgi:hypothetical protein